MSNLKKFASVGSLHNYEKRLAAKSDNIELKCDFLKNQLIGDQQKENLKQLNEKINFLRGDLENYQEKLSESIATLQTICTIYKRYETEKEISNILDNSGLYSADSDLDLSNLTLVAEHERNKVSLHKTLLESQDQLKELLIITESKLKSQLDDKESEMNQAKKISLIPYLEESFNYCSTSNEKCAEIMDSLQRLILHQKSMEILVKEEPEA